MPACRARRRTRPVRVAIVGGGCAAVSTAFELTRPEHEGRYEVTLYQLGWRLGGKGASGRGAHGRIEEHGLHVWMGWYENAFRLLRECYTELTGDADAWRHAFLPTSRIGVTERTADSGWSPWIRDFPPAPGLPGDPVDARTRPDVRDYARRTIALLRSLLDGFRFRVEPRAGAGAAPTSSAAALAILDGLVAYGETATLAAVSQAALSLEVLLGRSGERSTDPSLLRFVEALAMHTRRLLQARLDRDPEQQRIWHIAELALATLRGYVTSGLLSDPRGFDAIDDLDCREWLRRNGASEAALDCGYLRGLYDLGFGYEDGDPARPSVSAAQAIRGFLRAFFTYRGAFFWKMRGGMGDVVFAPFYEVLRRRGVRFRFFHRLINVGIARRGGAHVATLDFDVQAALRSGRRAYDPLVTVRGMPCWPSEPRWEQLADGTRLRRERRDFECHWDQRRRGHVQLRVGRDFDLAVLGIGLGAVPFTCRELIAADPRWAAMVEHVKTVPTQALQLWLRPTMPALGWTAGPITLSGFVEPFDTWADMSHLLELEGRRPEPGALAYFCSVLPDEAHDQSPAAPRRRHREVQENAARFVARDLPALWPGAVDAHGRWRRGVVVDRYWRANVNPSDRYTLALPGTSRHRISPLDRTYDNFTICGDWTDCGFNSGCVEAAVMSGRLAAHAIAQRPALDEIVGYDHP